MRAICFFPHSHINQIYNHTRLFQPSSGPLAAPDVVLFAHERLWRTPERLRDAWLTLSSSPALAQRYAEKVTADPMLLTLLQRWSGVSDTELR